jgi:hypothetical protein
MADCRLSLHDVHCFMQQRREMLFKLRTGGFPGKACKHH